MRTASAAEEQLHNQKGWQAAKDELLAALKYLNSLPKEAFADFEGAPHDPDHAQASAAQQWQRKACEQLKHVQELISIIALHGALQSLGSQAARQPQLAQPIDHASSTSFWSDIRLVAGSRTEPGLNPGGGKAKASAVASSRLPSPQQLHNGAENGHAAVGRRLLIEEINRSESSQRQRADTISRGGIIIEELSSEENDCTSGK